ncbi:MAG: serine/threonine protein kinase, partial [Chitinophagaceae bacterium]|nr:serine/threonine protein kinase [Chitinophagaceae bacterium]
MSETHNEQYIKRDKIGEGGMGTVYLGEDVLLERPVAIKVMNNPENMGKDSLEVRFQQEALALARLNHPNITHLYAFIPKGDTYWMVMEYVEGKTLEEWLKIHGSFNEKTACSILCQVLDGLAHAHQKGIIHRDLKPANVMISTEGEVKIMDFGIARIKNSQRLTQLGKSVGTIEYMAPEQIQGKEGDELTDIYAAGNILYEILSGQTPFKAETDYHLMKMKLEEKIPRHPMLLGKTSSAVQEVIFRSLAANPAKRFANAGLFKEAILKNIGEGLYSYNELSIALGQDQSQSGPIANYTRTPFLKKFWLRSLSAGLRNPGSKKNIFSGLEHISVAGIWSYVKDWNVNKSIALLIIAVVLSGSMVLWSALQSNQNEDIPGGSDVSTTDISASSLPGNSPGLPPAKSSGIIEGQLIQNQQPIIRLNKTEGEEKRDSSVRKEVIRSAPAKRKEDPPADKKEKEQIVPNEPASPQEP